MFVFLCVIFVTVVANFMMLATFFVFTLWVHDTFQYIEDIE